MRVPSTFAKTTKIIIVSLSSSLLLLLLSSSWLVSNNFNGVDGSSIMWWNGDSGVSSSNWGAVAAATTVATAAGGGLDEGEGLSSSNHDGECKSSDEFCETTTAKHSEENEEGSGRTTTKQQQEETQQLPEEEETISLVEAEAAEPDGDSSSSHGMDHHDTASPEELAQQHIQTPEEGNQEEEEAEVSTREIETGAGAVSSATEAKEQEGIEAQDRTIIGSSEEASTDSSSTKFPNPPKLPTKNPPRPSESSSSTTTGKEGKQPPPPPQPPDNNNDDAIPVIMIPSFAGTRLRNWNHVNCGGHAPLSTWYVGGSIWLDIKRLLAQTTCWINCLKLDGETQQDNDLCVVRPDEGLDAITQVDEQLPTGFLWKEAIDMLATELGYQPSKNMLAHPYDWRLPPLKMEQRDKTFSRLKLKIERISFEYLERNPNSPIKGLVVVGFSMGNLVIQYFFEWLEMELGRKNMEFWVDKYIYALLMAGAPHLGAPGIVNSVLGGDTVGLPITKEQSRAMYTTWGSEPWMMPFLPAKPNRRHMAMNHEETDFPLQAVKVTTKDGQVLEPTNSDIVQKDGWFQHGVLPKMQTIINKWYGEDPIFGGSGQDSDDDDDEGDDYHSTNSGNNNIKKKRKKPLRKPWKPPKGIDHIICSYGVNVETTIRIEYQEDPYYPGYFQKVEEVVNHRGDVFTKDGGKRVLPKRQRLAQRKSGDGSVPYFSLSWCHSWFGKDVVNVTKVPANRQYEKDEIERFVNINLLDPQQKQKVEKLPHGYNTFFTKQWTDVVQPKYKRQKSVQVWEFEGLTHRDSVTHPLFLRIWRDLLKEAMQFSRTYVAIRERVLRTVWEEMMEESGTSRMDGVTGWLGEVSLEGANTEDPSSDDDCLWDYAMVRCARPRYCEYKYQIGDVHLSQSCRLRETPLALDDPILLLQDAEAYNVSYYVGPDRVEWQTIYRPQDPGMLPPWAQITCAFLAGAFALAILLYLALRAYGAERLFGNNTNNARNMPAMDQE